MWGPETLGVSADVLLLSLSTALLGMTALAVQRYLASTAAAAARTDLARKGAAALAAAPTPSARATRAREEPAAGADEGAARLLDELRAQVAAELVVHPDDPDPHSTDATLRRFLRAVGGRDVAHAARRLLETARWRHERQPWAWTCAFCERLPGHHTWRQFGVDQRGRPVVYSCLAQAATHRYTAECAVQHCVFSIEQAMRTMPAGEECWTWVCDFSGFSTRAVDLSMCAGVIDVVGRHFPERLGLFLVVNTPRVFMPFWRALQLILDPNTTKKAMLVADAEETRAILAEVMPAEDAAWLLAELTLNRARPLADSQRRFWQTPPPHAAHDPRGTAKYVATFLSEERASKAYEAGAHRPHPSITLELRGLNQSE